MKIREIEYIHLAGLFFGTVRECGVTKKKEDVCVLVLHFIQHARKELNEDLRPPSGSEHCDLFLHISHPCRRKPLLNAGEITIYAIF